MVMIKDDSGGDGDPMVMMIVGGWLPLGDDVDNETDMITG